MARRRDIFQTFIIIGILIVFGLLSSWTFKKIDLTQEQRHSLTQGSIEMLETLEEDFHFRCYLHGEFPAKFKRLEQAIRERLDEFKDYSNGRITYEFIDPYEDQNQERVKEKEKWLFEQGLEFTMLYYMENGIRKNSKVWPGVIMNYKGRDMPVQLFKSAVPEPTEEMVNSSINNLEYELTSSMRIMFNDLKQTIGILDGHGELPELEILSLTRAMQELYDVERITLDGKIDALSYKGDKMRYRINKHDAIIVAKPTKEISFQDRVILDQYLMNGGKIMWMVDPINVNLDTLRMNQFTMGTTNEVGIYDQLFHYGVRLNRDIVIDYSCAPIYMASGPTGNQEGIEKFNWYFSPLAINRGDSVHPISANLEDVFMEFASSMDLVNENPLVEKKVILKSSKLSKTLKAPVRISSGIVDLDRGYFENNAKPDRIMGVLLEGEFSSAFKDRLDPEMKKDSIFGYRENSAQTKMIVISDGDICRNTYIPQNDGGFMPMPLGYDRYERDVIYDNQEFLMNALNYLLDDKALISIRSRTIKLRKLNRASYLGDELKWQVINVLFPLIIILLAGFIINRRRQSKYSKSA